MVLLSSLISALFMWLAIWLVTRREGSVSLKPVLVISLGSCVLTLLALRIIGSWGIALVLILLIFAQIHWLFLSWPKSILIALIWLLSQVAFGLFVSPIF